MDDTHLAGRCPRCGRPLPADAPEGLCAACLFAAAADPLTALSTDEAPTKLSPFGAPEAGGAGDPRLADGMTFGPYRIGRLLGRGGMGEVYQAEDVESGRRLALKVLRGRLHGAEDRARFLREGQLAASVSHPHTVYIFGSEEIAGMPVITMELLPGGTLKDRVDAQGPLPCPEAVAALLDIIGGLDAAQAAGILHRDIKPSNCFTAEDGGVKVGDFGLSISTLARDVEAAAGPQGFQGTPQFAPPEQLRGEPLDVRADIYAAGATLYYLLTGTPPFEGRDLRELLARVTGEAPVPPQTRRPEIPAGLAAVVLRCLEKDPRARPPSYAALADALRPYSFADRVPARLGLRFVAGLVDLFLVSLPSSVMQGWTTTVAPAPGVSSTATVDISTGLVSIVYYLTIEGLTGASLGKRLFGLRVASENGAAAFRQIALRTMIFSLPGLVPILVFLGMGPEPATRYLATHPAAGLALSAVVMAAFAAMFSTARRANGYAGAHELASGTRVIARAARLARKVAVDVRPDVRWTRPAAGTPARCGPFEVLGELGTCGGAHLMMGFDPVLRRRVWIRTVPDGTPPVSASRRDVNRAGRLHWLSGRRSAGANWDAFEAPAGEPLLAHAAGGDDWPIVKSWLLDLARELAAAERDATMPEASIDRVWIRADGHAVLLDFPAPGASSVDAPARLTPAGLLGSVAARALGPDGHHGRAPRLPLSAASLLARWTSDAPAVPAERALADLQVVLDAPDRVTPRRRALPVALAAMPTAMLLAGALLVVPIFQSATTPHMFEVYGLLATLGRADGAEAGPQDADERLAIERYLAGRHRATLADEAFWSSPVAQGEIGRLRGTADEVMSRHPVVAPESLRGASDRLAPRIASLRADFDTTIAPQLDRASTVIAVTLSALGLGVGALAAIVSALAVPGGVLLHLLGLAVVTRRGAPIGRARSLARALVAWAPAWLWFGWLGASPIERALSMPISPMLVSGLVIGVMAAGAIWSLAEPERGPVGRLTRTRIAIR